LASCFRHKETFYRFDELDAALPLFNDAIVAFEKNLGTITPIPARCNVARLPLRIGKIEEGLSLALRLRLIKSIWAGIIVARRSRPLS
jgi:hypothetical protein